MTLKSVKRDKHHRVQSATRFHLSGANFFLTICRVCLSGNEMLDYIIDHQRGGATVFSSSLTLPQKFYKLSLMNMVMTMMMMMMMT